MNSKRGFTVIRLLNKIGTCTTWDDGAHAAVRSSSVVVVNIVFIGFISLLMCRLFLGNMKNGVWLKKDLFWGVIYLRDLSDMSRSCRRSSLLSVCTLRRDSDQSFQDIWMLRFGVVGSVVNTYECSQWIE